MEIVQQAVIVNPRGEVLLLRRPQGVWQFPGGRLEEGEGWEEGLRREVSEETGIDDLQIVSILMVDNFVWEEQELYSTYFLTRTSTNSVRLSSEHVEYRWVGEVAELTTIDFWHDKLRILTANALASSQ